MWTLPHYGRQTVWVHSKRPPSAYCLSLSRTYAATTQCAAQASVSLGVEECMKSSGQRWMCCDLHLHVLRTPKSSSTLDRHRGVVLNYCLRFFLLGRCKTYLRQLPPTRGAYFGTTITLQTTAFREGRPESLQSMNLRGKF